MSDLSPADDALLKALAETVDEAAAGFTPSDFVALCVDAACPYSDQRRLVVDVYAAVNNLGRDLSTILTILARHGYGKAADPILVGYNEGVARKLAELLNTIAEAIPDDYEPPVAP